VNLLHQITETADALTEPTMNREPYAVWDGNRNRKIRHHITVQPGLLAQLYQSVIPASSSEQAPAGGVPGSRPPLAVEALSRHDQISMAVLRWCASLDLPARVSVESNVRALVGAAAKLDEDTAAAMLDEMRQWRSWCTVYLGWENIFRPAGVPCPLAGCGALGELRVNLTSATALCRSCSAAWTEADGSINLLAEYIRTRTERVA
jgi:hypothetical protein